MGKTTLALHWAHRVKTRFPDGNLYANLHDYGTGHPAEPAAVLDRFLVAFDVAPHKIPHDADAKAALFRSLLDERSMLVILDNAATAEQLRPLIPGSPGCLTLVTSRNQLTGLVAADGAHPLSLDLFTTEEARELLRTRLGAARLTADVDAVEKIIIRCARLPIALAVVAARAAIQPGLPLRALADELADARHRLNALSGQDSATDLRAIFSTSCRVLTTEAARLFRLLSLHPGPDIAAQAAASLSGCTEAQVRPLLAVLAAANLIVEHTPGRYSLHSLLRSYAAEQAHIIDPAGQRRIAIHRLLDHYLHSADTANRRLDPNRDPIALAAPQSGAIIGGLVNVDEALNWLRTERPALLACVELAKSAGFATHAWQLSSALAHFLHRQGHWHDSVTTHRVALKAAEELGDLHGQALIHRNLARVHVRLGDCGEAEVHFLKAANMFGEAGMHNSRVQCFLALAWMLDLQGKRQEMLGFVQQAIDEYRPCGDGGDALTDPDEDHLFDSGEDELRQELGYYRKALQLVRQTNERYGEAHLWNSLGQAHHRQGDHARAATCYRRALHLFDRFGDRYFGAVALARNGDTLHARGDLAAARTEWQQALDILDDLDHPGAKDVRAKLRRSQQSHTQQSHTQQSHTRQSHTQ